MKEDKKRLRLSIELVNEFTEYAIKALCRLVKEEFGIALKFAKHRNGNFTIESLTLLDRLTEMRIHWYAKGFLDYHIDLA